MTMSHRADRLTAVEANSPEIGRTWRQVNDSVYVEPEPGPAHMRLIAGCAVRGTIASQPTDLPVQFDVRGLSPGAELRWELLSAFARSVVAEMDCTKPPVVPSAQPASV